MIKVDAALIDVGTWTPGFYGRLSSLDPLGIEYLGAELTRAGYKTLLLQKRGSLGNLVNELLNVDAEIIGISSLTCNIDEALDVARKVKERNRKTKVVLGGYHASALPEDCLKDSAVDFVVVGEGENGLLELVSSILSKNGMKVGDIPNIGWKEGKAIHVNPRDFGKLSDLKLWPLREDKFLKGNKMYQIVSPPISEHKAALVSYSRNCSYHCRYCASPWIMGSKVRHRDPNDVVNEMLSLKEGFGVNLFYFTDLTFNISKKKVEDLCSLLKGRGINWHAMCSADVENIDKKMISLMRDAGMAQILFGLESLSPSVLKEYGRVIIQDRVNLFSDLLRVIDEYGLPTRLTYMIGEINETEEDLRNYLASFKRILPDGLSIKILTPFPGTPLFKEYKNNGLLSHKDWGRYDIDSLVFKHPNLSEKILKDYQSGITKQYYESDEYAKHVKDKIRKNPNLKRSFLEYFKVLASRKIKIKI